MYSMPEPHFEILQFDANKQASEVHFQWNAMRGRNCIRAEQK